MDNTHKTYFSELMAIPPVFEEPMKKHTTFGIGGHAAVYMYPSSVFELAEVLSYTHKNKIPVFFAGSGSNLLVSDEGFDGVVITLQKTFKNLKISDDGTISVDAGVMLGNMVKHAIKSGIKGLESLIGVPGTVGGALIMNAGAFGSEISNYFENALVLTSSGETKKYTKEHVSFSYRTSTFPKDEILISAVFNCEIGNAEDIQKDKLDASKKRKENQPLKFRSAGSIFKNPNSQFAAGYLIDKAGLKGTKCGNAEISPKHANFIVNLGDAHANDVIELIRIAREAVVKKFNIKLELEVKLLGFSDEIIQEFGHA